MPKRPNNSDELRALFPSSAYLFAMLVVKEEELLFHMHIGLHIYNKICKASAKVKNRIRSVGWF